MQARTTLTVDRDGQPNPDAIAWYVRQAESLLGDLHERAQSLRMRAGQIAGFSAAVIAIVGGNADRALGALGGPLGTVAGIGLLAGTVSLVAALATAILGAPFRPQLVSHISAAEIANYTSERFTHESDLWRVHLRTINGLLVSIESTTRVDDRATRALRWAGGLFLIGLLAVTAAFCMLIVELTFL